MFSMSLPTDLGTWGFILSVIALIAMYPVGILINVTSPKLQNSWATRSQQKITQRIVRLKAQLKKAEELPLLTSVEGELLLSFQRMNMQITLVVHLILGLVTFCFMFLVESQTINPSSRLPRIDTLLLIELFGVLVIGVNFYCGMRQLGRFRKYRLPRTQQYRDGLVEDLNHLPRRRNLWVNSSGFSGASD
jgi:hypothetical protein